MLILVTLYLFELSGDNWYPVIIGSKAVRILNQNNNHSADVNGRKLTRQVKIEVPLSKLAEDPPPPPTHVLVAF